MLITRAASTLAGVAIALGAVAVPAQAEQNPPPGADPMIIGGGDAKDTHGAVRLYVDGDAKCTATIIDPEWVLTAKHCLENVDNDDAHEEVSVKIGNVEADKGEEVHAKEEGVHRNEDADLALVQLEHSVETDYAQLAKWPFIGGLAQRAADIYGWGATCDFLPSFMCQSPVLKKASVVIDDTNCEDAYGGRAVCATRRDGIAAKGDSGGPMFVPTWFGGFYQVGVASQSDFKQTTVYTNVMEYQDWIEEVMDD